MVDFEITGRSMGFALRRFAVSNNLTQKQVADICGLSLGVTSRYFRLQGARVLSPRMKASFMPVIIGTNLQPEPKNVEMRIISGVRFEHTERWEISEIDPTHEYRVNGRHVEEPAYTLAFATALRETYRRVNHA